MYNATKKKYLYYCYKKKHYKVPTYGRIFKIIDFGRSIYKYDQKVFCSDSFQPGADAATQYNTEPYFNEKKPRLEPNYSFDLCRLACSIFDFVVEDAATIPPLEREVLSVIGSTISRDAMRMTCGKELQCTNYSSRSVKSTSSSKPPMDGGATSPPRATKRSSASVPYSTSSRLAF